MARPIPKNARTDLSFANLGEIHRKDLRDRLARIEGHLKGLGRQMESGADCHDLLIQASAIRSALGALMGKLLEAHIDTCVKSCAARGRAEPALERLKGALVTALRQT
jgi:DNA-binding FrmR family transcriptional regulator